MQQPLSADWADDQNADDLAETEIVYVPEARTLHIELGSTKLTLEAIVPVFFSEGSDGDRRYVPFTDDELDLLARMCAYLQPRAKDETNRALFGAIAQRLRQAQDRRG